MRWTSNFLLKLEMAVRLKVTPHCHGGRRGAGLAASDRSIVYGVTSGARNLQKTQEGFTFKFEFVGKGSQSQDTSELIINGERKVKKEELHFKVKAKDVEPNHEKEELHFKLTVTLLVSKYCFNLGHQPRKSVPSNRGHSSLWDHETISIHTTLALRRSKFQSPLDEGLAMTP
ncbi:hypothetical protein Gotur_010443 [Gossypium turneri]